MAAAPSSRRADVALAVAVVVVSTVRNYAYKAAPDAVAGNASAALGAAATLFLLVLLLELRWSVPMLAAAALWGFEEVQALTCNVWFMVEPWHVDQGQDLCSAKAEVDIGAITVLASAVTVLWLHRKLRRRDG